MASCNAQRRSSSEGRARLVALEQAPRLARSTAAGLVLVSALTFESSLPATTRAACPLVPQPTNPFDDSIAAAADQGELVLVAGGAPNADELEGSWPGSLTMTSFSTPFEQARKVVQPKQGVPQTLTVGLSPKGASSVAATLTTSSGPQQVAMSYSDGKLSGGSTHQGVRYQWQASVTSTADGYKLDGTWTAKAVNGTISMSGTWTASKAAEAIELKLTYPVGKSPKVFRIGWPFGAECIKHRGKPDQEDLSETVKWGGTGTFNPEVGKASRPAFSSEGANKIKLTCGTTSKEFAVEVVRSAGHYARVGDLAQVPADAHGCPACPHPCVGPGIVGSSDVLLDGRPVLRVGDVGIHAACCGPNMWRVIEGDPFVLVNGRPVARLNDKTQHCGATGRLIQGSSTLVVPGAGIEPARSSGYPDVPLTAETIPAGSTPLDVTTDADQRKVLLFSAGGSNQPAAATLFPNSAAERTQEGALFLKKGAALVTTPSTGAGSRLSVGDGSIELHSQALVSIVKAGTHVVLLTGTAELRPKRGSSVQLVKMQQATFSASGLIGAVSPVDPATLQKAFAPMTGAPAPPEERTSPLVMPSPVALAAIAGVVMLGVLFVLIVLAAVFAYFSLRRRHR